MPYEIGRPKTVSLLKDEHAVQARYVMAHLARVSAEAGVGPQLLAKAPRHSVASRTPAPSARRYDAAGG